MKHEDLLGLPQDQLTWLRLPGMVHRLADIVEQARTENLSPLETISRLADEERVGRISRCMTWTF